MKTLLKLLVLALVAALLLAGGLFFTRNSLIAGVIAKAGTTALGTKTTVDGVETDFGSGAFAIRGLEIDNPEGYGEKNIFSFGAAETDLPLANLRKDPLVIERVALSGLNVSLERKNGKFNYEPILESLKRFSGDSTSEEQPAEESAEEAGPGKVIRIDRIDIADWTLQLDLSERIQLDPLKLEGWTIEDVEVGGEQATAELVGRIFNEVLERVLSEGLPGIPADVLNQLGPELDALKSSLAGGLSGIGGDLQVEVDQVLQQGQDQLDNVLQEGKEALEESLGGLEGAGDELINEAENALKEGLGGLLGGKKKD